MNELYHHGIKGQQWGVMHGPPYPIDRSKHITIKKGSKFSHVTNTKKMRLDDRGVYAFDPNDEHDSDVYRGAYSTGLKMKKILSPVYEQSFETVEDLKLPTRKEKVDAFIETVSDRTESRLKNGQTLEQYLDNYAARINMKILGLKMYNPQDYMSKQKLYDSMIDDGKKWIEKRDKDSGYKLFMGNFAIKSEMSGASQKFVENLIKRGYNAIIDDNDSGRYNDAHNPLYVFNGKKSLKNVGRRKVTIGEMAEATDRLKRKLGRPLDYT